MQTNSGWRLFGLGALGGAALAGLAAYLLVAHPSALEELAHTPHPIFSGQRGLVNPILDCTESYVPLRALRSFTLGLRTLIGESVEAAKAKQVAVYFRDLNNGPWVGVDEREPFVPASLLKLPTLISVLKLAENKPSWLKSKIVYHSSIHGPLPEQRIPPRETLKDGTAYTIEDLLDRVVRYSDNRAAVLLGKLIPPNSLGNFFDELGLSYRVLDNGDIQIGARDYATFFRVLYNTSYLNKKMSEKALELLTRADFQHGLRAGVPEAVTVARKFGERFDAETKQLHDCGIVYHPKVPYVLCIMTKGRDFDELAGVIRDVSAYVYVSVDERAKRLPPAHVGGTPSLQLKAGL